VAGICEKVKKNFWMIQNAGNIYNFLIGSESVSS